MSVVSRVDELIAELCPDGVEFRALGDVFGTRNGYTPSKSEAANWTDGMIPWFRMEDIRDKGRVLDDAIQHIPKSAVKGGRLFPANSIIVATSATIGEHALVTVPFMSNQRFTAMWPNPGFSSRLDMKFVHYYCFVLDEWCRANVATSSFAQVDMSGFKRFRFPVPPLDVQREIVRVLDTFTVLEADLEAELEARRRQYAHYRDSLLTFLEGGVRWATLGELLREPLANGRSVPDGSGYPVLRLTALHGPVVDTSQHKLGAWDQEAGSRFRIEAGDLLIVRGNGSKDLIARACMVETSEEVAFPDTMIRVRPNLEQVSQRYLFHIWESRATRSRIERIAKRTAGVWKVSQDDIARVELPVPSVEEQARIVSILDRFDALVNDLSSGLPAELAARRKQYEHYRDRLLTFKEAAA